MQIRPLRAYVFDAYGTLFDVHSIMSLAESLAPGQGAMLSQVWRTKQLQYTWLQSLMMSATQPRDDFAVLTAKALDYAVSQLMLPLDVQDRQRLLAAYDTLAPFSDAVAALEALAPSPRFILSNGTRSMLESVVRSSSLAPHLDGVLSVDDAGIYKPAPAAYALAVAALGVDAADIGFVSSNGWDAAGAKAFGFTTFWINRDGMPTERHAAPPDFILDNLTSFAPLVAALPRWGPVP
ncbi:MAG: haloacid dehalogenase type II [Betaproteobacteria bacterium]